jgi:NAD(P)-dependent dehydrogenase (short-subunit alcohol dehydrogenase family)
MKAIVITGSTRGIGYGLADAFLARDCSVAVSGRAQEDVEQAVAGLAAKHGPDRVFGQPCDVTQFEQVQALWDAARARYGQVDIWINNAGISHPQMDFCDHPSERIKAVVDTNLIGAMNGAKVALAGILEQGFGAIYNMEGLGSDGRKMDGLTLYGCTKYGLRYLTDALVQEAKGTPVIVGALRPGMVMTDLVTRQFDDRPEEWERAKRIFNIIADRAETVTPWMADKILANTKSGIRINWMTGGRMMIRFLTAPFRKRNVCD